MKVYSLCLYLLCVWMALVEGRRRLSGIFLAICHLRCSLTHFNCNCESQGGTGEPRVCIPRTSLCDGWRDCADGSDEIECVCPPNQYQCGCEKGGNCFANAIYECKDRGDPSTCNSFKTLNGSCAVPPISCDGVIDCPWVPIHDETNCSECPRDRPNRCDCNAVDKNTCYGGKYTCYADDRRCNRRTDCSDTSDEVDCNCDDDEFKCQCYKKNPVTCPLNSGCIPSIFVNDGVQDCPDGSDETPFRNVVSKRSENVTIWRMIDTTECHDDFHFDTSSLSTPMCRGSHCFRTLSLDCSLSKCTSTDLICSSRFNKQNHTSRHEDKEPFQCSDGSLFMTWQFCNNAVDCSDDSDEVKNEPGFKCFGPAGNCVLPQRNLYDNISHCADGSDLCFDGVHKCFQCLDQRLLISSKQVCDGIVDCYDMSDECTCIDNSHLSQCDHLIKTYASNFLTPALDIENATRIFRDYVRFRGNIYEGLNISVIRCQTKWGERTAVLCDGRPECRDFSDECACENPPKFCNDTCHSFYPLGDRYCDGFEDEAWIYINSSWCPRGFDETLCPKRYSCIANDRVSIDVKQVCDGVINCDDGSDEAHCFVTSTPLADLVTTTDTASTIRLFSNYFILISILALFGAS